MVIEVRITTRRAGAPIRLGCAYVAGVPFHVDERVDRALALPISANCWPATSSPCATFQLKRSASPGRSHGSWICVQARAVLRQCFAATAFPEARIDAVDFSAAAASSGASQRRGERHCGIVIRLLRRRDLFGPLGAERYDLILNQIHPMSMPNPMADLAARHRHEPALALAGRRRTGPAVRARILLTCWRPISPRPAACSA